MVKVAVAGGTSPMLGRCIVEALVATGGKHDVVILSRTEGTKYGARVIAADYSDQEALTALLKKEEVHTLISVIRLDDLAAMLEVHQTLLNAAQAAAVNRFVLSDWSLGPLSANIVEVLAHKNDLHDMGKKAMEDAKAKGEHVVECCTMQNGLFMEYFVFGSKDCWFDDPFMVDYIDVKNDKLIEPCQDDGSPSRSSTTSLKDIGRFVTAAMDLGPGKLVGRVGMSGQVLPSYGYVADILESQCGKKMKVEKFTPKDCDRIVDESEAKFQQAMQNGEFDLQTFMAKATAQMVKVGCEGKLNGAIVEGELNKLCPQVKPIQVEEMLVQAWGKAA